MYREIFEIFFIQKKALYSEFWTVRLSEQYRFLDSIPDQLWQKEIKVKMNLKNGPLGWEFSADSAVFKMKTWIQAAYSNKLWLFT